MIYILRIVCFVMMATVSLIDGLAIGTRTLSAAIRPANSYTQSFMTYSRDKKGWIVASRDGYDRYRRLLLSNPQIPMRPDLALYMQVNYINIHYIYENFILLSVESSMNLGCRLDSNWILGAFVP